jgi:hypothetical protein
MQLVYNEKNFRHRFRMCRKLFSKMEVEVMHDSYFVQKIDVTRLLGLSSIQKCIVVIRMLPNGVTIYYTHKYCRLNEFTALECLKRFMIVI